MEQAYYLCQWNMTSSLLKMEEDLKILEIRDELSLFCKWKTTQFFIFIFGIGTQFISKWKTTKFMFVDGREPQVCFDGRKKWLTSQT